MTGSLLWLVSHLDTLLTGFVGGLIGGVIRWRWPSWKDFQEERQSKRDKDTDARVMALLDKKECAVMTLVEICQKLGVKEDEVRDSLERLETRGRVRMSGPTHDGPACWFSLRP